MSNDLEVKCACFVSFNTCDPKEIVSSTRGRGRKRERERKRGEEKGVCERECVWLSDRECVCVCVCVCVCAFNVCFQEDLESTGSVLVFALLPRRYLIYQRASLGMGGVSIAMIPLCLSAS